MKTKTNLLLLSLRCALALSFLYAGLLKIGDPAEFARGIANYHLLPSGLEIYAGLFVPWLEIVVGASLALGLWARSGALLSFLLSLGFGLFVGSALVRGLDIDCGCFGGESNVGVPHLLANVGMVLFSLLILKFGPGKFSVDARWETRGQEAKGLKTRVLLALGLSLCVLNVGYVAVFGVRVGRSNLAVDTTLVKGEVRFEAPQVDLGVVRQEDTALITARYINVGQGEAVLTAIESTCGCTEAKLGKTKLLPGESSEIQVSYSPGDNIGKIAQSVSITQEGRSEPIVLDVTGSVDPMVEATPTLLRMSSGETVSVELKSRREGYRPVVVGMSSSVSTLKMKSVTTSSPASPLLQFHLEGPMPRPPGQANSWPIRVLLENAPPCVLYLQSKEDGP